MNEEIKKNYINNMSKEYRNLFISIKTCAESNKSLEIHLNQQECKLIMRYLFKNMSYKSRCEKAIEYIENNKKETSSHFNGKEYVYRNFTLYCEPNDLINILQGSDENE